MKNIVTFEYGSANGSWSEQAKSLEDAIEKAEHAAMMSGQAAYYGEHHATEDGDGEYVVYEIVSS